MANDPWTTIDSVTGEFRDATPEETQAMLDHNAAYERGPDKSLGELDRAIWLFLSTDDYAVIERGETWADLIYIHNSPPHPITHIEIRGSK